MTSTHNCAVCDANALDVISGFTSLPRATSDSKPWPAGGTLAVCWQCGAIQKIADAKWLDETAKIYGNYDIYHQSGGSEQLVFKAGVSPVPRSQRLVDYVLQEILPTDSGQLLDIGCGNGATLRNFARALPNWKLYGSELSAATLNSLRQIGNFSELFVGPLDQIPKRFSLVSLVHTLEHLRSPRESLLASAGLLEKDGTLFIEVPDIETSPFDLLVADHRSHFSRATLSFLATRSRLRIERLSNEVVFKEITLLATCGTADAVAPDPKHGIALAKAIVSWLQQTMTLAQDAADKGPVGIFGTAIAGMALYGAVSGQTRFFVDEDPNRIGRVYDGRPVLDLNEAPRDVPILIALPASAATSVLNRCRSAGLRCIAPPGFGPLRQ